MTYPFLLCSLMTQTLHKVTLHHSDIQGKTLLHYLADKIIL